MQQFGSQLLERWQGSQSSKTTRPRQTTANLDHPFAESRRFGNCLHASKSLPKAKWQVHLWHPPQPFPKGDSTHASRIREQTIAPYAIGCSNRIASTRSIQKRCESIQRTISGAGGEKECISIDREGVDGRTECISIEFIFGRGTSIGMSAQSIVGIRGR